MKRPLIICHMTVSIDGKVTGAHLMDPRCQKAEEAYYQIHRDFKAKAFACGRVTMEGSFTGGWYPDLTEYPAIKDRTDHIADASHDFYAVCYDRKGRLGWKENVIHDEDSGYDNAYIIEVLTEDVDDRYLGYLKEKKISYIFAGKEELDVSLSLEKLYRYFGIEKMLLEGGSIINGAFLNAGMVDELSLVQTFLIGDKDGLPLFGNAQIEGFDLISCSQQPGYLYLRYKHV